MSKPRVLIFWVNSVCPEAKFGSEISPEPWAMKPRFREAMTLGSRDLSVPEQALRGFMNGSSPASWRS